MWFFLLAIILYICYRIFNKKSGSKGYIKSTLPARSYTREKQHITITPHRNSTEEPITKVFSNESTHTHIQTFVAGIPHRLGKNVQINSILCIGQTLNYQREPSNQYDKNAIKLMANGVHIGYIPRDDNLKIANHLDSAKAITVVVTSIDKSDLWRGVNIKVSLN